MSCSGCSGKDSGHCVCNAVRKIEEMQEAVEDKCESSCFSDLLSPTRVAGRDTIPFTLFCKGDCGDVFKAFGGVGTNQCFKTVFFRVRKVRKDCCATLELLRPVRNGMTVSLKNPCDEDFDRLLRTGFCIEVDLDCFCAIQCFSPDLVRG